MIRINPDVKFSYNLVKGSIESRRNFVSNLNKKVFTKTQPLFDGGKSYLRDIKKVYMSILERKRILFAPLSTVNKKFANASSEYGYNSHGDIIGQILGLKTKKSRVSEGDCVLFMHENTHVLDILSNPKYTARTAKMNKRHMFDNEKYNNWFFNTLYTENDSGTQKDKDKILKTFKNETLTFLKGKRLSTKIDYLQDTRNIMDLENHAYSEQYKYAGIIKKQNRTINEDDTVDNSKLFMFKEKAEILKSIAFELIKKERVRISKQFGK